MRKALLLLGFSTLSLYGTACGYDPNLGGAPFVCNDSDPKCPDGYECRDDGTMRMVCFKEGGDGKLPDANMTGGFQCADDSNLEHLNGTSNDTIQSASTTDVQTGRLMISYRDLAICPEGDKDTYLINLTSTSDIELVVTWDSGQPLSVTLLSNAGVPLANGTSNGSMSVRAFGANLNAANYYAQVTAAATTKNNYTLAINTTPK